MAKAYSLYKRYTQAELVALERRICEDPASRNPPGSTWLYRVSVRHRLDAIRRAVQMHVDEKKKEATDGTEAKH